jgi:site-specific recombinase XerD
MTPMLTLQRRHSNRCPDRNRGPHYVKCRGRCPLRVCGTAEDGRRVRLSLKTRDLQRATRRLIEVQDRASGRTRKTIVDAVQAFKAQQEEKAAETKRKYKRILGYLVNFCDQIEIRYVDQVTIETMDRYTLSRQRSKWAWIKEIEVLRQFFDFCRDRDWTTRNPANSLKRPRIQEANQVVPYTRNEIVKMIAACDRIGKTSYERRRARAMVLLMRYAGLRISDVVTLSRDHIRSNRLERRATKNKQWIRVELPPVVIETLEILPPPKGARQDNRRYFYKDEANLRTLVKGAWRTLAAVFEQSGVNGAIPHRFRHTLASELLGKGGTLEEIAAILADSPATIRRYYAKWTPEYQSRQDVLIRKIHGTDLAQTEEQVSKC